MNHNNPRTHKQYFTTNKKSAPSNRRPNRRPNTDANLDANRNVNNSEREQNIVSTNHLLYGYQPIVEALNGGYTFKRLLIQKGKEKGESEDKIEALIAKCRNFKIPFFFQDKINLDKLVAAHAKTDFNHQGLVAELKEGARIFDDINLFLQREHTLALADKPHFVIVLDRLSDPHNVGAISRSAYFFGSRLIALESHHSAPLNATTHKISCGASLLLPYLVVEKLQAAIETLKSKGYQIVAAHTNTEVPPIAPVETFDFAQKVCLIIGSEAEGIRPHLLRLADSVVAIPGGQTPFNSLNASAAAAIFMYSIQQKQRSKFILPSKENSTLTIE